MKYAVWLILLFPVFAYSQEALFSDIDGADGLTMLDKTGGESFYSPGEFIGPGNKIKLNSETSVSLIYDNGMEVHIAPSSEVVTAEPVNKVPGLDVVSGRIRSFINKESKKRSKKFLIKTPTAVVGVRGTDFVVDVKKGETRVSTLRGVVEVAPSLEVMRQGGLKKIKGGQLTRLTKDQFDEPAQFDKEKFIKSYNEKYPRLRRLKTRSSLRQQKWSGQLREARQSRRERFQDSKRFKTDLKKSNRSLKLNQKRVQKRNKPKKKIQKKGQGQ